MRSLRCWLLILAVFTPPALAGTHGLRQARAELSVIRAAGVAHRAAAATAAARSGAEAARAVRLAAQQVQAAAALRKLEDQTATAASTLYRLQTQATAENRELKENAAALATLLPVMQRLTAEPAASLLAVPRPPAEAVRGVIVIQGIASQVAARIAAVKQETTLVAVLRVRAQAQQVTLAERATTQNQAELTLSRQIAAAKAAEMVSAQTALTEQAAALAADRKLRDLQDIVDKLLAMPPPPEVGGAARAAPLAGLADEASPDNGAPVAGDIIQRFGDNTAAGPAQGISYRAGPGARVVATCAGPVKFANRFQSYGMVVIADCGAGNFLVLSGLAQLDVTAGQVVAKGQPVGQMPGINAADPARQPVLYVELRHDGTPINPAG